MLLLVSRPASAQIFESVGIRAQGMAGAFVAVADDATATWWNPAGLVNVGLFSGLVERRYVKEPSEEAALGVAFAVPSMGVSYYRLRVAQNPAADPTGTAAANRQDTGAPGLPLPTFVLSQIGVTVGQSLGGNVILASTLKLIRADQIRGDIDIGMLVKFGAMRAGLSVKHLHPPDLTADGNDIGLGRQVRVGAAYAPAPASPFVLVLAVDADVTTLQTAYGETRRVAGGAEFMAWKRLGVRGGVSANTIGERRTSYSAGASAAVQQGLFVDGQITRGDDEAKQGWGIDLRVTF